MHEAQHTCISILHKYDYNGVRLQMVEAVHSISILHKYDYNGWYGTWRVSLARISILHKYDYNGIPGQRLRECNQHFNST